MGHSDTRFERDHDTGHLTGTDTGVDTLPVEAASARPDGDAEAPTGLSGINPRLTAIDHALRAADAPPPPDLPYTDVPLLYVVDVPASRELGATVLTVMHQRRISGGGTTRPKPIDLAAVDVTWASGTDRRWLAILTGAARREEPLAADAVQERFGIRRPATFVLPPPLAQELLPQIARIARAWVKSDLASDPVPLAWDDGEPWRFGLQIDIDEDDDGFVVRGELTQRQNRIPLGASLLLVGDDLIVIGRRLARLERGPAGPFLPELLRRGPLTVTAGEASYLGFLLARAGVDATDLPDALRGIEVQMPPVPCLALESTRDPDTLAGHLLFDYGGSTVAAHTVDPIVFDDERARVVVRDLEAEAAARARLRDLHLAPVDEEGTTVHVRAGDVLDIARELMAEGWHLRGEAAHYRMPGSVHLSVASGIDWFDLTGTVSYAGEQVPLTRILEALRHGSRTIELGDGSTGLLPERWLEQYAAITATGTIEDDRIRFSRAQGALVDALLAAREAEAEIHVDATFAQVRRELASFSHITPLDPAPSFRGTLRPYQREGLGWFAFLRRFGFGGCLADDMGLGKTIMVLALLDSRRAEAEAAGEPFRPSLIVVPRSLVGNWKDEASRFTPELRVLDASHTRRSIALAAIASHDVVIVTYGTLRRDIAELAEIEFDYVVLDEAQAIKNAGTAGAKAARLLRGRHRLALSGTPIENHLGELWSLFEFLNPGVLGRARLFERAATASGHDATQLLARGLRPFILRRTKAQVAGELPPRTEQTILCDLEPHERALYDSLRRRYRQTLLARINREGLGRSRMHVLEALLRLRQAACHAGLIDPSRKKDSSAKFDILIPRLQEVVDEGDKALVFSQFTSLLALLRTELDKAGIRYEYLDGRTRNRTERIDRFQSDPDVPVFLISLKAGGLGLNLTTAAYVFLLDPWWNPAVESQAIDRAHRIGQTREVFAYRIVARDTIEEKVLALQQKKRDLADALLSADAVGLRHLSREDLELLLS